MALYFKIIGYFFIFTFILGMVVMWLKDNF